MCIVLLDPQLTFNTDFDLWIALGKEMIQPSINFIAFGLELPIDDFLIKMSGLNDTINTHSIPLQVGRSMCTG